MDNNVKKDVKSGLIVACIGAIVCIPYWVWNSFWCLCLGIIIIALSILHIIYSLFKKEMPEPFWGVSICAFVVLSILCLFWHDDRYISDKGEKQHIYADCHTLANSKNVKMVTETEGFFHLVFTDCKVCEDRKYQIAEQKKINRRENKREELRDYFQSMIDRLDAGENPYDIEEELIEDWSREEEYDDYGGVPSRYR